MKDKFYYNCGYVAGYYIAYVGASISALVTYILFPFPQY